MTTWVFTSGTANGYLPLTAKALQFGVDDSPHFGVWGFCFSDFEREMFVSEMTSLFKKPLTLNQIKQLHAQILTKALSDVLPSFIHHFLLLPSTQTPSQRTFQYVHQLFDHLPKPDAFTYACIIRFFSKHGQYKEVVYLYIRMNHVVPRPSTFAVSRVVKACARIPDKVSGISIHCQVYMYGYSSDVYVQTSLVDFYSRVGDMANAERVFYEMPERNVVSWNSLLFQYVKAGELTKAHAVFNEIPEKDVISWNSIVSGYSKAGLVAQASSLFQQMSKNNAASWNSMTSGYADNGDMESAKRFLDEMPHKSSVSWVAMISGYSKCGDVASARELFDWIGEKDLLYWNSMISCYAQNTSPKEAIQLFKEMSKHNVHVQPDKITFSCIISACSQLGDFKFGLWIESYMDKTGVQLDDHLATALVDLYSKCGSIERAHELFHGLKRKDVVSYSAMILGCGINGKSLEAIRHFEEMLNSQICPNAITYTGILTAYNHAALVEEGYRCFSSMTSEHGVTPTTDHYRIVVDLLGRGGKLEEAYRLIKSMPMRPHAGVWGTLLLARRLHSNVELGEIAAEHCVELEPDTSGYYSLLANIYAFAERWDEAKKIEKGSGRQETDQGTWL